MTNKTRKTGLQASSIFGFDVSNMNTKDKPALSMSSIIGSSNDEYLKEKGLHDIFENADDKTKEDFTNVLRNTEHQLKDEITIDKLVNNDIKGLVRSKEALSSITDFFNHLSLKPTPEKKINLGVGDLQQPIDFNSKMEGKFKLTHVAYDTEANKVGQTILNSAVNWEAKRIVVNYKSDTPKFNYFTTAQFDIDEYKEENQIVFDDSDTCILCKTKISVGLLCSGCKKLISSTKENYWQIIFIGSNNLWDCLLVADYETLLATIFISALMQNHYDLISIYDEIKVYDIPVRIHLLEEILFEQRKSLWFCHNNAYDIPKLNNLYKIKRGKRQQFSVIKNFKHKFITVNSVQQSLYNMKLGNISCGFRFSAESSTQYSTLGVPNVRLCPKQANSFTYVYHTDTMLLGIAGQKGKNAKLSTLSKGLVFEKIDLEDEKNFTLSDIEINDDNTISEKLQYNLLDSLSTMAVYADLSHHFDITAIEKALDFKIETTYYPLITRIISTASVSKIVLTYYLSSKLGMSVKQIEHNMKLQREYFDNFAKTYQGGSTDAEIAKHIQSDPIEIDDLVNSVTNIIENKEYDYFAQTKELIMYLDYRSQYPHADWLINAELKLMLSAQNKLHNYLNTDLKVIQKDFWKFIHERYNNPLKPFSPDFFYKKLDGNATVELLTDLEFRKGIEVSKLNKKSSRVIKRKKARKRPPPKRQTDIILKKGSIVTCHLADLAYAVLDKKFFSNTHKVVKFISAERLDLPKVSDYGQELFTKLYLLRKVFEDKFGKNSSEAQLIKIIMNAIYGLTAEGFSKQYLGKFLNYSIASSTTALARFFTKYAKLMYRYKKSIPIYNDTDSVVAKATLKVHEEIRNMFSLTIPLEYESDLAFHSIKIDNLQTFNIQHLEQMYVLGKKKYGIKYLKNVIFKIYDYYAKKHGIGQHAFTKAEIDPIFAEIYEIIISNQDTTLDPTRKIHREMIERILPKWKYWSRLTYKKDDNPSVVGIKAILKDSNLIKEFEFYFKDVDFNFYHRKPYTLHFCNICDSEKQNPISKLKRVKKITKSLDFHLTGNSAVTYYYISPCCKSKKLTKKNIEERYLVTNLEPNTFDKGTFGDYFLLGNIIFYVACDIKGKFTEFCEKALTYLTENKFIPRLIKPVKYNKTELALLNHLRNFDQYFDEINQPQTEDGLYKVSLELFDNYKRNKLIQKIADYFNLDIESPSFVDYLEETIKEEFLTNFQDFLELLEDKNILPKNTKLAEKKLLEHKIDMLELENKSEYQIALEQQDKVKTKLFNLVDFKPEQFSRDLYYDEKSKLHFMKPKTLFEIVNDTPLDIRNDFNRKFNIDGWNIYGSSTIQRLDFTTNLQAYQTRYFRLAIENFAYIFSMLYYRKEHKNENIFQMKANALLDKDKIDYPIAKERNNIVVPFKIKQYWNNVDHLYFCLNCDSDKKNPIIIIDESTPCCNNKIYHTQHFKIKDIELLMSINENEIINYLKKSVLSFNKEKKEYSVLKPIAFNKKMDTIKEKSFWNSNTPKDENGNPIETKWMNRLFAFELLSKSTSPHNINATLTLDTRVGDNNQQRDLDYFTFNAELRVNPTQRGLYNLDLLKTSINELNDSNFIIKELINSAIDQFLNNTELKNRVLQLFSNNASLTKEDMINKKDKSYAIDLTYLVLCFKALQQSLKSLRFKLKVISLTENIKTNLNPKALKFLETQYFTLMEEILKGHIFKTEDIRTIALKLKSLKQTKHSDSDGSTINNKYNQTAIGVYIKNRKQFVNKLVRTTKNSFESLVKALNRSKHIDFDESTLRVELTIKNYTKMLQRKYVDIFDNLVNFIKRIIAYFEKESTQEAIKPIYKFNSDFREEAELILKDWLQIPNYDDLMNNNDTPYYLDVG